MKKLTKFEQEINKESYMLNFKLHPQLKLVLTKIADHKGYLLTDYMRKIILGDIKQHLHPKDYSRLIEIVSAGKTTGME